MSLNYHLFPKNCHIYGIDLTVKRFYIYDWIIEINLLVFNRVMVFFKGAEGGEENVGVLRAASQYVPAGVLAFARSSTCGFFWVRPNHLEWWYNLF